MNEPIQNPEISAKLDFLILKINESFDFYLKRRERNRLKAFRFKMAITVFSVFITILAGLNLASPERGVLNILVLVFSGLITIFSTWDTFYNHKELWVKYTDYVVRLHALRTEAEFLKMGIESTTLEDVNTLFERYKFILEDIGRTWVLLRRNSEEHRPSNDLLANKGLDKPKVL